MTDSNSSKGKEPFDTVAMERAFDGSKAPHGGLPNNLADMLSKLPPGTTLDSISQAVGSVAAARKISQSLCKSVMETGQAFIAARPARNVDGSEMDDADKAKAVALESLALGMVNNVQNLMKNVEKYHGSLDTFTCTPELDALRDMVADTVAGKLKVSDIPTVVIVAVVGSPPGVDVPDMRSVWTLIPGDLTLSVAVTTENHKA